MLVCVIIRATCRLGHVFCVIVLGACRFLSYCRFCVCYWLLNNIDGVGATVGILFGLDMVWGRSLPRPEDRVPRSLRGPDVSSFSHLVPQFAQGTSCQLPWLGAPRDLFLGWV